MPVDETEGQLLKRWGEAHRDLKPGDWSEPQRWESADIDGGGWVIKRKEGGTAAFCPRIQEATIMAASLHLLEALEEITCATSMLFETREHPEEGEIRAVEIHMRQETLLRAYAAIAKAKGEERCQI